jgi:hypothetical protein
MVEESWGEERRVCCAFGDALKNVLRGEACIKSTEITNQN